MTPRINEISWLIKNGDDSINVVGFLRDHKDGVFIIGGETGSHYSGHSETWKEKWDEYINQNYMPVSSAIEQGVLNDGWTPPEINKDDQEIVDKINNKIL